MAPNNTPVRKRDLARERNHNSGALPANDEEWFEPEGKCCSPKRRFAIIPRRKYRKFSVALSGFFEIRFFNDDLLLKRSLGPSSGI